MEKGKFYVNISAAMIIKIILILIMFYFLFIIRDILAIFFVSLVLASAFDPWVDWMQKKKVPRSVGIVVIYILTGIIFGGTFALIIPPIIQQSIDLASNFPQIIEKITSLFSVLKQYSVQHGFFDNISGYLGTIGENVASAAGGVFSTVTGFIGSVFSFFLILVITFYMVVEENAMKKLVVSIAPKKYQVYIMQLVNRMQQKVGLWLRGQIILSVVIFALTYAGLLILGVKYALILALIAGLTEFVPYLGPIIASVPAIFLTFTQSPTLALFVAILYYIVQLVENNIVVPKVMQKVVGLNPIISIAVLMIGYQVGGIVGAILSIPVTTAASVFIEDYFDNKTPKTEDEN